MTKIIWFALILLISCSHQRPMYEHGAYGDRKLDDDTFIVSFKGGSNEQQVQNLLYVRCSEIALENGYPYFVVLDSRWERRELTSQWGLITWDKSHTYSNKIKLLLSPDPKLQNFDAKAIYTARIKEINQPE